LNAWPWIYVSFETRNQKPPGKLFSKYLKPLLPGGFGFTFTMVMGHGVCRYEIALRAGGKWDGMRKSFNPGSRCAIRQILCRKSAPFVLNGLPNPHSFSAQAGFEEKSRKKKVALNPFPQVGCATGPHKDFLEAVRARFSFVWWPFRKTPGLTPDGSSRLPNSEPLPIFF